MRYDDYLRMRIQTNEALDKFYDYRQTVESHIERTGGSRNAKVREAHIQEILNNLEEVNNLLDWFMDEE